MSEFKALLESHAARIETTLVEQLGSTTEPDERVRPERLMSAIRHSSLDGGKRLRPFLVMESAALFGLPAKDAVHAACALECIHCYSLVHDDLPAMDDDDLRRGRPTTHRAFDEATAILAGDALLTFAFDILSREQTHHDPAIRIELVRLYARSAGLGGMVGGQMLDLEAEKGTPGPDDISVMQSMKTGALLRCACETGAVLANASVQDRQSIRNYGDLIGQAFQLADDILDVTSDAKTMGKKTGKDADRSKGTLVGYYGLEKAQSRAHELLEEAIAELEPFGDKAKILAEAARFTVNRER